MTEGRQRGVSVDGMCGGQELEEWDHDLGRGGERGGEGEGVRGGEGARGEREAAESRARAEDSTKRRDTNLFHRVEITMN